VRRHVLDLGEQPVVGQSQRDVLGQHPQQRVGDVHGALGVVLRQPDLERAVEALDLPAYAHLAAQKVDVADLQGAGLPEA
jgi:hypothetical protein